MSKKTFNAVYIIAAAAVLGVAIPADRSLAQLGLPQVPGGIRDLPTDIDRRVRTRAERAAEKASEEAARAVETAPEVIDEASDTVDGAAGQIASAIGAVSRVFVPGIDPDGADIEANVVVALVDDVERESLLNLGYTIISERELGGLGRTMLTLRQPSSIALPDAVKDLRDRYPAAAIDYNHVYRFDEAEPVAAGIEPQIASPDTEVSDSESTDQRLRIGIIDSAVLASHRDFSGVDIVARDLATADGKRPLTHGTGVASLVVRSARKNVVIFSASVFFQAEGLAPGASTEALVAALDWLASENVDVVNMSLSGPENILLEAAVAASIERGNVIVAAVGNNGPNGEPLYPGAYNGVIGVTAVDRDRRIFRNANRGEHVDFAALGVNVKVADSETGGWRIASGTSMASPHIAVVAAHILRGSGADITALNSWLMASAEDLGRKGQDPVYGHGLITQPPLVVSGS
ncbi:MAG: S8 family serine peptidase [Gammaproteobacteria bacterium]|nr:S8 family serine peptidase [Gammaproteobacteria bacterium]